MAWRDGRSSAWRLSFFLVSIALGVAALVAIGCFDHNLRTAVDDQARSLLGADLRVRARRAFDPETEEFLAREFDSESLEEARRVSFSSMAVFPKQDGTRLVRVRAVEGDYPFYGDVETIPPEAASTYHHGRFALVDDSLLHQFSAEVGDTVRIGTYDYKIAGRLVQVPGESATRALFGPRIYVPRGEIDPQLLVTGSRVTHEVFYRGDVSDDKRQQRLEVHCNRFDLEWDTVEDAQRRLGRSAEDLGSFLGLVGFVAVLLGGLGIGSAIHVLAMRKVPMAAVLRCLGAPSQQVLLVFLIQAAALGLLGAVLGTLLGISVQELVPWALKDFLRVELPRETSWQAVFTGVGLGLFVTMLFVLLPLVSLRRVPPMAVLRSVERSSWTRKDPLRWGLVVLLALASVGFAMLQTGSWSTGSSFAGGVAGALVVLALVARLLMVGVRRLLPETWPYVVRQSFANLHRPGNQTTLLLLCIGLGTFLLLSVDLTRGSVLQTLDVSSNAEQPNLVLFDVQDDQVEGVREEVTRQGGPLLDSVPIVNMRIARVNGKTTEELRNQEEDGPPTWSLIREYRSTYRGELSEGEELIAGSWVSRWDDEDAVVPVSFEERQAERLDVTLGDTVLFDVQGVPLLTKIASIREVDWRQARPNFFVVFPEGVLEEAPKFHVLLTRAESTEASAQLQRAVVDRFPNVSAVDIKMVLNVLEEVLQRLSFAVRFMALFTILVGVAVLAGAILSSRFQRMQESVLLRVLGASRTQVLRMVTLEYLCLGILGSLAGGLLAVAGSWSLSYFLFRTEFRPDLTSLAVAMGLAVLLTTVVGGLSSWGITRRSPLGVLRSEGE